MIGSIEFWIIWIALAFAVAIWAGRRGRDPAAWGAASLFITPLFAWIILLAIGPVEE